MALSCGKEKTKIDVSNIKSDLRVVRFEQLLFSIDTNNVASGLLALKKQHPVFSEIYFKSLLGVGDSVDLVPFVKGLITNAQVRKLYDTTQVVFAKLEAKDELDNAFKHVKYYFPQYEAKSVYTYISEFSMQQFIFSEDDAAKTTSIGLGLDLFLGNSYPYKSLDPTNPNFSDYLVRSYNKEHLVSKAMNGVIDDIYVPEVPAIKMLDKMIENGKKLYLKKLFCPEMSDTLLFEYSEQQMKWVEDNELEIWSYFLDNNLLVETSLSKINKYINPSPNAPGMPAEAPGATANFIGYKIVDSYMNKNSATISQLLKLDDGQKLLNMAKYKARR